MGRLGFWIPALLWLPAGMIADEALRTGSAGWMMTPASLVELPAAAPCGIPLALTCRRLARSGYPGPALMAWIALGGASAAGLLAQLAVGFQALLASLPVWVAAWRLARRPRGLEFAPSPRRPGRGRYRGSFRSGH